MQRKIQEQLLHYVWATQQFDKQGLKTTEGVPLRVIDPGKANEHAGPDFLDACIRLGMQDLRGDVELHVESKGWYAHKHHLNGAYDRVILHVVWQGKGIVRNKKGSVVPTLFLSGRAFLPRQGGDKWLSMRKNTIACGSHPGKVAKHLQESMLAKAWEERKEAKVGQVYAHLKATKNDTEETTYRMLMYSLGAKINSDACLQLAKQLPLLLLKRNYNNLHYLEALLLGQAGLLPSKVPQALQKDVYAISIIETYAYLKHKYRLTTTLVASQWKFFRLRPASFPTLRLVQMAALVHTQPVLFDWLMNFPMVNLQHPAIVQSSYWQVHYHLGKKSQGVRKGIGKKAWHTILINSVVPLLIAYGRLRDDPFYTQRAEALLVKLPPEDNSVTRLWKKRGMLLANALATQSAIALYQKWCLPTRCLQCCIGQDLLASCKHMKKRGKMLKT